MPNVPVPIPLRDELRRQDLVVWSATRVKKGEPITVEIAGPALPRTIEGWGATIEDAVASALRHPLILRDETGFNGALFRLDEAMWSLRWCIWQQLHPGYLDALDDDIPF